MKKNLLIVFAFFSSAICVKAQVIFEKTYHDYGKEEAKDIRIDSAGNVWMYGMRNDTLIMRKADKNGNLIYQKQLKIKWRNYLTANAEGFVFGYSNKYQEPFRFMQIDTNGNLVDSMIFDTFGHIYNVYIAHDGSLILGKIKHILFDGNYLYFYKISIKNKNAYQFYSTGVYDNGNIASIYLTTDGGVLFQLDSYQGGSRHWDGIFKINGLGKENWSLSFSNIWGGRFSDFAESEDAFAFLTTYHPSTDNHYSEVSKYSKSGSLLWTKLLDSISSNDTLSTGGLSIKSLGKGYALLTDYSTNKFRKNRLLLTDTSGKTLSTYYFGIGGSKHYLDSFPYLEKIITNGSSIYIYGNQNMGKDASFYLIRMNDSCKLVSVEETQHLSPNKLYLYPNPANNNCHLQWEGVEEKISVSVYDLTGRIILQSSGEAADLYLDLSALSKGAYILKAARKKEVQMVKLMKE